MRRPLRVWITTLALGLTVGGCLPCVPGVRVDQPRTAGCLADQSGACGESRGTAAPVPRASVSGNALVQ